MDELVIAAKQNLIDESMKKRIITKLHTDIRNNLRYSVHSELVDRLTKQLKDELVTELTEEFNNSTEYKTLKLEMSLNDSEN
jgi:transcriptional accessory protein Tex/SPT6